MWVELRELAKPSDGESNSNTELRESYLLARSFWIRAATLDGLAAAALLIVALGFVQMVAGPSGAPGFQPSAQDKAWSVHAAERTIVLDSMENRRGQIDTSAESLRSAQAKLEAQAAVIEPLTTQLSEPPPPQDAPAAQLEEARLEFGRAAKEGQAALTASSGAAAAALAATRGELKATTAQFEELRKAEMADARAPRIQLPAAGELGPRTRVALTWLALLGALLCWHEAGKNDDFQRKELMATLQWHHLRPAARPDENT